MYEKFRTLVGKEIILTGPAKWKNTDSVETLPAGTILELNSWRPEGYMATIKETRESFFLFHKYLERGIIIEPGEEMMIRRPGGLSEVECAHCGSEVGRWDARYFHINRAGEVEILCPDCAAIVLGESGGIFFRNEDEVDQVIVDYFTM